MERWQLAAALATWHVVGVTMVAVSLIWDSCVREAVEHGDAHDVMRWDGHSLPTWALWMGRVGLGIVCAGGVAALLVIFLL